MLRITWTSEGLNAWSWALCFLERRFTSTRVHTHTQSPSPLSHCLISGQHRGSSWCVCGDGFLTQTQGVINDGYTEGETQSSGEVGFSDWIQALRNPGLSPLALYDLQDGLENSRVCHTEMLFQLFGEGRNSTSCFPCGLSCVIKYQIDLSSIKYFILSVW